jgi:hypothetical protein
MSAGTNGIALPVLLIFPLFHIFGPVPHLWAVPQIVVVPQCVVVPQIVVVPHLGRHPFFFKARTSIADLSFVPHLWACSTSLGLFHI